ncbi:glutamate synthase (ferredoxin) [Ruminococcus sp. YE71]|uniref:glutamate synthase large subunit n=1 Tax=unclassified Ruminococcus TaxID=2608920 RepID=UPI0008888A61|nr:MULTISPECIES: glutamate synthase large subunit [unclassified Ruminococcus]SDA29776.1 glutamate synthase (ferredoxin) [Ruminococcus sp. YE78]SFW48851.1 glutamate synthase (ferredoxin) [Ruminococcus sp. YE71]
MKENVCGTAFENQGLYRPEFEHDNCGIGAVVNIKGERSRKVVDDALTIVEKLEHRAGKDAEGKTGDGVGLLSQIPYALFRSECEKLGFDIGGEGDFAVGMFFLPQQVLKRDQARKLFEIIAGKNGMEVIGWREVPSSPEILGQKAFESMPCIMQCFVRRPDDCAKGIEFERRLYVTRRIFEQSAENTYVCSLSSRTVVYKGMFLVDELRRFYTDLQSEDFISAIAMVHSRFSTNTIPSWQKAHPNRMIVHNGEINTITGNADKMLAREETMSCEAFKDDMYKILPAINADGSDSARLDNALEFMVMSGMPLPLAVMITIPEPWKNDRSISKEKYDFYQYYATMMEPWDGPASIIFSDGEMMGAVLDRNGLRPSRYCVTSDGFLVLSSETGCIDIPPEKIVSKDRLRPGKMLLVDTKQGRLIGDEELKNQYATRQPYGEWLDTQLVNLHDLHIPNKNVSTYSKDELLRMQKAFGYSYEDIKNSILPMAENGAEPIASMGSDIPLPPLDKNCPPLFNYFRQNFAQVTNPPFDAIREEIVTDTSVYIGEDGNILEEKPENCHVLKIEHPILTETDMLKIKNMDSDGLRSAVIPMIYYIGTKLEKAIERLYIEADRAYRNGANILILSDRGVDEFHCAIPSLLAVAALQQHLVSTKKRTAVALILESAEPREVHHFAALLGYGACAVNPYLAHETIHSLIDDGMLDKDFYAAEDDYNSAVLHGIVKIASKMGISTIQSYQGSKLFEAVGISDEVISKYFRGTVSRIGGITLSDISRRTEKLHNAAFDPLGLNSDNGISSIGSHKLRSGKSEHLYTPETIHLLQQACRTDSYETFKKYTACFEREDKRLTLRSLLDIDFDSCEPISIDEVESVESICHRFKTGAMSYGSISQEAHECLAEAMNRIGGRSNSGEGGESPERLLSERCSAIKQVASGRFGVTSEYLVSAKEIQIKMAQGAKPGEGGHLPSKKVYPWIAKTRHSTAGVGLISPPPHHDIYSIEDLAQLIYDLKNANRSARISVKLVAEAGVGTVAAGVAKAGAEVILISGFDGGTGAAPKSSIYSAGLPWEMGLAEVHQTLIMNGLRSRVRLETDGKLMTGRDVLVAALLGAEEFGFATAPLITMGCVMMRVCDLDTCPMGIATQNPELRKRFSGKPEYVINFMHFIAQELREYMARLGIRTVDELIGRTDLLSKKQESNIDFTNILYSAPESGRHFEPQCAYDFKLEETADEKQLLKKLGSALRNKTKKAVSVNVSNTDRAFGTLFGSEITKKWGDHSLDDNTFTVHCTGSGGQSFGAFIPKGLTLELCGDANDYFGKGLSGGRLILSAPKNAAFDPSDNIIVGNVALYGATSGKAFIGGIAGERFCVRNSGASAVCEGVGDHGCEYMTGGVAVILGRTGKNFAAGMSGGIAFVLDEQRDLYMRLNKSQVSLETVSEKYDVKLLRELITEHAETTGSLKAKQILESFEDYIPLFKKIVPHDFAKINKAISAFEEKGMTREQAEIEAFCAVTAK